MSEMKINVRTAQRAVPTENKMGNLCKDLDSVWIWFYKERALMTFS